MFFNLPCTTECWDRYLERLGIVVGMWFDRYEVDPLTQPRTSGVQREVVTLRRGLVVEHTQSEFCGAVVAANHSTVQLEDYHGLVRSFPLQDSFMIDGKPTTLQLPERVQQRARTASGSFAAAASRAKVARASRIFVEGRHDAELLEAVWGDDLREAAVVVELLDGADHLATVLADFAPTAERRAGVLLDHLVSGSKETRLLETAIRPEWRDYVRVAGHPYVDVWQAVKPQRLGLAEWPVIPRSVEFKRGILQHLGWPAAEHSDVAAGWQRILSRVRDYRDLEPALVGPVESLIDFVTVGV
ncbi:hypothetical protein F5897_001557 [Canibacter oris]|uniref:DUF3097 domain-containing protein n=2 Tax=Canibacter oris TaxID=1365628 RepID=A0A840DQ26_9MICO|nr:hypothetical protein [Canibacter oris]